MRRSDCNESKHSRSITRSVRDPMHALSMLIRATVLWTVSAGAVAGSPPSLSVKSLNNPSGLNSSQAHLSGGEDGRLILSWVEPGQKFGKTLKFSLYNGKTWSQPQSVVSLPAIYDLPKVIGLTEGAFGAVWGAETKGKTDSTNEVYVSHSADGGQTWSEPVQANSDRDVKTARYNAQIAPLADGKMAVFWSDARNRNKPKGTQYLMGVVMEPDGRVGPDFIVDDDICSCCQLLPARYRDRLYVAYRDRLPGEIRDIAVIPWPGMKAAKPVRVHEDNWVLPGCPGQNVGAFAASKRFGVAWFTAAGGKGKVQVAFAGSPETGFGEPIDLDPEHTPQGEVKMVMLDDDHAAVQWIRTTQQGPGLQVALVSADGKRLAESSLNTPSWDTKFEWPNMPTFTRAGDQPYFCWPDTRTGRIRLVKIGASVDR
ncbi:MAG: hypothetical protein ACRESZ_18810 [Methylococcales bacterium]